MIVGTLSVIARGLRFPEGPAFARDGSLWCVEMRGGALVHLMDDGVGGYRIERIAVGGEPNGLTLHEDVPWFCDAAGAIRRLDGDDAPALHLPAGHTPLQRPNDLVFSRGGSLVFTCPGLPTKERHGQIWCRTPAGDARMLAHAMRFPNGLAFSPDGRDLIVAETFTGILWRGDWEETTSTWRRRHRWARLPTSVGPDGIAFGPDGALYVALYGRGEIHVVEKDGRSRVCLRTPGRYPTNVAFDPTGELGLVITEAERGEILACPLNLL